MAGIACHVHCTLGPWTLGPRTLGPMYSKSLGPRGRGPKVLGVLGPRPLGPWDLRYLGLKVWGPKVRGLRAQGLMAQESHFGGGGSPGLRDSHHPQNGWYWESRESRESRESQYHELYKSPQMIGLSVQKLENFAMDSY